MVDVLDNKRSATKFRVLVEIADRQPAVNQGEIADAVGVTSQAVSEYIRELVDEGFVEKEARSRYRVTKEGVDWLFQQAADVSRFAEHVTEDVLGSMQEDAAFAADDIAAGETVSLSISDGLLYATPGDSGPATGVATTDAETGDVVGVTGFAGIIDLDPGSVTVFQVPPIRSGDPSGSPELADTAADADVVAAAGVEGVAALRDVDADPDVTFAAGEVAADAAGRGLDVVVVATTDLAGRVTDALRDAGIAYEVDDI
ncbi:arNOG05395 family transcription regulator [Natronomonas pharaonis DSM 2160]|uniref:ArNOG05395 family transcription regulator n=1 Tax=Natronomonas pharaonis (strain ATCC 35678 / DSM 2160 / CIP 103997 / JCM 8858 / NBRC 14720 / NCIMB 2260 / Gabara) TaxID=348780 RepID=A0A1U7EV65_NATPD|nr:MarR family transcriptional regulator [Natronomonas pharaonis]CAI48905.1 arNOG05395 family transcription regulator [Natronomonas pharaonis DSM 2160]